MISIQGGTFTMGADPDPSYQYPNGTYLQDTLHQVTLSNFQLSKYEITNAEFAKFLNAKGNKIEDGIYWYTQDGYVSYSPARSNIYDEGDCWLVAAGDENKPVHNVSWHGATAYCNWVGARLPTEAEWEYAAKGGNQSMGYIYAGSNNLTDANSSPSIPNELGLYNMSADPSEWCNDWYGAYPSSAQTNPTGAVSGTDRVVRGGSIYDEESICRPSYRLNNTPAYGFRSTGFRIAL